MEVNAKICCSFSFPQPHMRFHHAQYFVFTMKMAGVKGQGKMDLGYAKGELDHYWLREYLSLHRRAWVYS